ncbi:hypothetical protein IV102_15910 [bacterium]|nr:hypothetical protein [bacterium]
MKAALVALLLGLLAYAAGSQQEAHFFALVSLGRRLYRLEGPRPTPDFSPGPGERLAYLSQQEGLELKGTLVSHGQECVLQVPHLGDVLLAPWQVKELERFSPRFSPY